MSTSARVEPFRLEVSDAVLDAIQRRVSAFDLDALPARSGWASGTSPTALRELVDRWLTGYDWRSVETQLNRFPQLTADVHGTRLHVLREPGSGEAPPTVVLIHGWPSSFASFRKVIDALAHPERNGGDSETGMTVVVPSLPGYAFSSLAPRPLSFRDAAELFHELIVDVLDCTTYLVHGGDQGAPIAEWMAFDHPDSCIGLHTPLLALRSDGAPFASGLTGVDDPEPEETAFVQAEHDLNVGPGNAYFPLQLHTPLTLAPGLSDSPVGLAAWFMEKYRLWTDRRGDDGELGVDIDDVLTEVMIYLVSGSVASSLVAYGEFFDGPLTLPPGERISVPSGYAAYPDPRGVDAPASFARRTRNLAYWSSPERGGHFPALEVPEVFVADLRAFVAALPR
ncbi:epoxide hydrolase family protein [Kribbella sp. VKM Ac-2566]|uniref:epoxide hydrolase family protein n=1 Tax=Kribbella sp. VKM Ac-2566 TaxID=2512218 RepID=UPI0010635F98|nr:epoxide hydrolase family protein [Kribbella sp. VKM Ac-2566]TDX08277.1 pimeloyl-ACP methyl ester carboxylesterase [Kribbella sp. VKM Ac-2566]